MFALVTVAGAVWAFATPLFTGPDEVSQARRAAAVVRGQPTGRQTHPGPAILVSVDVPDLYGTPAEQQWLCHLGPLVPGAPQEPMALPHPDCPDLSGAARGTVAADTVQYRGQPFYYLLAGLPTLVSEGVWGAYAMRMVGVVLTAALVASAASSLPSGEGRRLAGLGLAVCLGPALFHLAGSTNPSALEIAAALSAWSAVAALERTRRPTRTGTDLDQSDSERETAALVQRLGVALVVLSVGRGLGPMFALLVLAALAAILGRTASRSLVSRTDVKRWGVAVIAGTSLSAAWLAWVSARYRLPDRPGSGVVRAMGWMGWYLRQSVGVFGTNDSAVSPWAAAAWILVATAAVVVGLIGMHRRGHHRLAAVASTVGLGGLALNVTAEGLSLPPIGFFWQGRYALPLLVGAAVLATGSGGAPRIQSPARSQVSALLAAGAATVLTGVQVHGLAAVIDHHHVLTTPAAALAQLVYGLTFGAIIGVVILERHPAGGSGEERWQQATATVPL